MASGLNNLGYGAFGSADPRRHLLLKMQDADAVKAGETPARDQARIARRMIESSTRLGRHRWAYDTYITGPGETTTS